MNGTEIPTRETEHRYTKHSSQLEIVRNTVLNRKFIWMFYCIMYENIFQYMLKLI
jgi:hypothetical protein